MKSFSHECHFFALSLLSPCPPLLSIFHLCISSVCGCFRVRNPSYLGWQILCARVSYSRTPLLLSISPLFFIFHLWFRSCKAVFSSEKSSCLKTQIEDEVGRRRRRRRPKVGKRRKLKVVEFFVKGSCVIIIWVVLY